MKLQENVFSKTRPEDCLDWLASAEFAPERKGPVASIDYSNVDMMGVWSKFVNVAAKRHRSGSFTWPHYTHNVISANVSIDCGRATEITTQLIHVSNGKAFV